MASFPPFKVQEIQFSMDTATIRSKIAIDKSPIAPFRQLPIGEDLSMPFSFIKNPPITWAPFSRAMRCRSEATLLSMPLVISQLVQSGPDSDFTMSMESLSAITAAACFDSPLALVFYNINNQFFFDEPLHHESHPWSMLFVQNNMPIDSTSAENLSLLGTIASCALNDTKEPQWFSNLKGDVVFSERSNQRWQRSSEQYLPIVSEDFSRSFWFGIENLSLHIGSNSIICEVERDHPAILRYCQKDPTDFQSCQWQLESILSSCQQILLTSSESMKLTRFEETTAATASKQQLISVFGLLNYIKTHSTEPGCYMLHKKSNSDIITMRKATPDELQKAKLTESYTNRISLIEMLLGFRQTLSTNPQIAETGRIHLKHAIELSKPLNKSLSYERIGDSLILPILLLNRSTSLIIPTNKVVSQIPKKNFDEAILSYSKALETENLPEALISTINHKKATALFGKSMLTKNDSFADEAMKTDDLPQSFKYQLAIWRCRNFLGLTDTLNQHEFQANPNKNENTEKGPKSRILAFLALELASTDSEKVEAKHLLATELNFEGNLNVSHQKYENAAQNFEEAQKIFKELNEVGSQAETYANLAHIERCIANGISISEKGCFTADEEARFKQAAKYYLDAIQILPKSKMTDKLRVDLASLYRSILTRMTQSPPIDRLQPNELIEEAKKYGKEARIILDDISNREITSTEIQRQIAALNVWEGRFITDFELKQIDVNESDPDSIEKRNILISKARNLFIKARQFLIADNYPFDYLSMTIALANLKLISKEPLDALRIMMDCLKALAPTTLVLSTKTQCPAMTIPSERLKAIEQIKPLVLDTVRTILKEILLDKVTKSKPADIEKELYRHSLSTKEDGIVNLIHLLKKELNL